MKQRNPSFRDGERGGLGILGILSIIVAVSLSRVSAFAFAFAFTPQQSIQPGQPPSSFSRLRLHGAAAPKNGGNGAVIGATTTTTTTLGETGASSPKSILKSYEYDGWNLTYRTIADDENDNENDNETEMAAAAAAARDHHNVLLVHPVGIGLASWFWERFLVALGKRNREDEDAIRPKKIIRAYAPNLIGCGISEGSDAWDPDRRGLFVPMGWVKGCEALMNRIDDDDREDDDEAGGDRSSSGGEWTVIAQGGLAPIGVLLANRNPERISRLILASPPTWKDMTTAVPPNELERNYWFFRSWLPGTLAFAILETRGLIEFFSNTFLFGEKGCGDEWLERTEAEMCREARPPVQTFNAGLLSNRGLGPELAESFDGGGGDDDDDDPPSNDKKKLLVVQGEGDKRPRDEYEENLSDCRLVTLGGATNVIPWEEPEALADLLLSEVAAAAEAASRERNRAE